MKRLLIIGSSGHGKVVANIAHDINTWDEIAFLDDDINKIGKKILGFKVIDRAENFESYIGEYEFIVGIGDNHIREKITRQLNVLNASLVTLVHPSAVIGLDVRIGLGTVVMPTCVINASSVIKEGCILNTNVVVDHDCEIESFVHLSPGTSIAGGVKIGEGTWIGMGANVINNVSVQKQCIIGAGAVVIKDILTSGTYVGIPVKLLEGVGIK